MNLPNYFLADLPLNATLTPALLRDSCDSLHHNRAQYLLPLSTSNLMDILAELGRLWLDPDFRFRKMALVHGPAHTGFAPGTLAAGLDAFFLELTVENFRTLLEQDLGHVGALDGVVTSPPGTIARRAMMVRGPDLLAHIAAGNLPIPALSGMVLALLTRSAHFLKCASGTSLLPRLLAHSLHELEPKLASCIEIAEWKGGQTDLEAVLFEHADSVMASGSDETLDSIRQRLPLATRFIAHGHRVSFGYITRERLTAFHAPQTVQNAARDVIAWDQCGCLSPHLFYVEFGNQILPEDFATLLADELARLELSHPRGPLPPEAAGEIASRRAFYEIRAANAAHTRLWQSPGSTAWTVVYEADPLFQLSCQNRFIYVKGVKDVAMALRGADAIRHSVSTVGLAASPDRAHALARQFALWGATRVATLGNMQRPPLLWRHDGRPVLAELVTWTDCEL